MRDIIYSCLKRREFKMTDEQALEYLFEINDILAEYESATYRLRKIKELVWEIEENTMDE